jgi:sterol 3beta-glucosyltransferase
MKITILAVGTRGDVQPYVALGLGLKAAGNEVRVAAASNFEQFIRSYGLEYGRLEGNFRELMEADTVQQVMTGRNPAQVYREMTKLSRQILDKFSADLWQVGQGADGLIYSTVALTGYSIAEKLKIPSFWAPLQPMSRTRSFPSVMMSSGNHSNSTRNWLTHLMEEQMAWQPLRAYTNQWRKDFLGLPPYPFKGLRPQLPSMRYPIIYGFSPSVVSKPPDWADSVHVSGYWFLDQQKDWQPHAELVDFIKDGEPPIYIGFGSMNNREAAKMTRTVIDAVTLAKQRAVVATGWGSLTDADLPDTIYKLDAVPHNWLFPQMAAVVHHGGAGTAAAAFRAGVPSVIIPHLMDQPFWGWRAFELGVSLQPIPRKQVTAENLANAMTTVLNDDDLRQRASSLGKQIRSEDGIAKAVELATHYLSR